MKWYKWIPFIGLIIETIELSRELSNDKKLVQKTDNLYKIWSAYQAISTMIVLFVFSINNK